MTTIAADRQCMAADTALVMGETRASCCKIFRIKGALVGTAGGNGEGEVFLRWYKSGGEIPKLDKDADFCALVLNAEGLWHYEYDFMPTKLNNDFWAIGTGAPHALTAMNMGATPEEAVRQAVQFDVNSSLPVDVFQLKVKRADSKSR
jgi:hypothetical protein